MPDIRNHLEAIYRAAIAAVDPAVLVGRALDGAAPGSEAVARLISEAANISLLAIGKGSYAMAAEFQRRLGGKIEAGLAVVPATNVPVELPGIRVVPGGHPIPDRSSADAAHAAIELLKSAGRNNLVVVLLSGGASAMFAGPASGVSLEDKIAITAALLRSGATIRELNCVRKHISAVKGGGLLDSLSETARVVTLILSDVPGDDVATIGSGLTMADPSTYSDAIAILKRRRVWGRAPEAVREHLESGVAGDIPETPKSTAPVFQRVSNLIIGNNATAVDAAAERLDAAGFGRAMAGIEGRGGRSGYANCDSSPKSWLSGRAGGRESRRFTAETRRQGPAIGFAAALELAAVTRGGCGRNRRNRSPTDAAGAFAFPTLSLTRRKRHQRRGGIETQRRVQSLRRHRNLFKRDRPNQRPT